MKNKKLDSSVVVPYHEYEALKKSIKDKDELILEKKDKIISLENEIENLKDAYYELAEAGIFERIFKWIYIKQKNKSKYGI